MIVPSPNGAARRGFLTAVVTAAVLYAGLCKALLLRNLEYYESDLFTALETSWSWFYAGRFLHDNAYGDHAAIHGYYLMPALAVLTLPFGAYGLILALTAAHALAAIRVARTASLDGAGKVAVLAAVLGPVSFYVFDNPVSGVHADLFYPPLATLFALDLAERRRRGYLVAAAIVLVKEDGALLCAAVLLADLARRLLALGAERRSEWRGLVSRSLLPLSLLALVFAAGLGLLALRGTTVADTQATAEGRSLKALRVAAQTLAGEAAPYQRERLLHGLAHYGALAALILLPLGRRFGRGAAALALAAPPVLAAVLVSAAFYRFQLMMWPSRIAILLGMLMACVIAAAAAAPASRPRGLVWPIGLMLASFALQLALLRDVGYSPIPRLALAPLSRGDGYRAAGVPAEELRLVRCLAARLPGGLPVSAPRPLSPVFHRQSFVFSELVVHAWHAPRLWVHEASAEPQVDGGFCSGPRAGNLRVTAECDLTQSLATCGS